MIAIGLFILGHVGGVSTRREVEGHSYTHNDHHILEHKNKPLEQHLLGILS